MICPGCQADNDVAAEHCARCGTALTAPTAVMVTVDLSPGTLFHGRYRILGPLGRGGMGSVYRAHDTALDEAVAIKVLRPDYAHEPAMAERFKSEIRLARKVRHRNVCTIHDFGEEQGLLFISMELVEGVNLKQLLKEKGALPADEAYELALQIAEGLTAVHEAGIIHRDLKTPNVMCDGSGRARLMDFGIAKLQGSESLTATGAIMGTPEYMSPEQGQGHKVDYRTDVYSLGVVIYELFTGQTPFHGDTPISTILKHIHESPPLEGQPAARIPPAARVVLRRALAKDPRERYATPREFAEALRQARHPSLRQVPASTDALRALTVRHQAVSATPWIRRRWPVVSVLVFAVVGTLLVIGLSARGPAAASPPPPTTPSPPPVVPSALPAPAPAAGSVAPGPVAGARATPRPPATRTPAPPPPRLPTPTPLPLATPVSEVVAPQVTPRAQAYAPPTAPDGSLQVVARPWAEVSIDGRLIGETPLDRIPLPPGPHSVRLRHPAFEPLERAVTIKPGQGVKLVVDLPEEAIRKH